VKVVDSVNALQRINVKLVGLVVAAIFALSAMAPIDTPPKTLLNAVSKGFGDLLSPKVRLGDWQVQLPAGSRAEGLSLDAAAALFTQHAAGAPELSTMAPGAIDACQQLRSNATPTATIMICRTTGGVEAAASGIEQAQQSLIARAEAAQQSIVARTGLNPFWIGGSNVIGADLQELAGPGRIVGEGVRPFEIGPLTAFGFCFETAGTAEWYSYGNADTDLLFLWAAGTSCEELWPIVLGYGSEAP
jgi:hypothetical protein